MSDQPTSGLLPWPTPAELTHDQRARYDLTIQSHQGSARLTPLTDADGRLNGPFNALLFHPAIGDALDGVSRSLRRPGIVPQDLFQLIILLVAVERGASYEWYAHAPLATRAGVSELTLAAIREGRLDDVRPILGSTLVDLVLACLHHEEPSEVVVMTVQEEIGIAGIMEVVNTVAHYDQIATLLRVWRVPLPDGVPDPLV